MRGKAQVQSGTENIRETGSPGFLGRETGSPGFLGRETGSPGFPGSDSLTSAQCLERLRSKLVTQRELVEMSGADWSEVCFDGRVVVLCGDTSGEC